MILADVLSAVTGAKNAIITGVCVFALTLPLGYCHGVSVADKRHEAERLAANAEVARNITDARDAEAVERVNDALDNAQLETELTDAIADTPDTVPDPVRVQLGCQRLRRQGALDADLPVACRAPNSN